MSVLPWNYHRTGTKANWNGKAMPMEIIKRGVMPLKMLQCNFYENLHVFTITKVSFLQNFAICIFLRTLSSPRQPQACALWVRDWGLAECSVFQCTWIFSGIENIFYSAGWAGSRHRRQPALCLSVRGEVQFLWAYISSAKNTNSNLTIFHPLFTLLLKYGHSGKHLIL